MSPQKSDSSSRAVSDVPRERALFKELLLAGQFDLSPVEEAPPGGDTAYEQLVCIGYRPQYKRLDAVVQIKQDVGYSGGICTSGSQEYVEFFASTDGGTTWTTLGTVSFNVWDVPGPKPLDFDVSLPVDLAQKCCQTANIVLVRGILSWQVPPTGPTNPVVWGNALDAEVQVAPLALATLQELLECLELPLKLEAVSQLANLDQIVEFAAPQPLGAAELHALYQGTQVPQTRYLLGEVTKLLQDPVKLAVATGPQVPKGIAGLSDINISQLIAGLLDPQGNETYEQLGCVGFNAATDELVATIQIKLSSGYSGGLCTAGSQEYVAFWVDWGGGFEYAGTTSVNVHDIATLPAGGLQYSAALPFPQALAHQQQCTDGAVTPMVRAVLSWATPPSTTDAYAVPFWGGHLEGLVLVPPGEPVTGGGPLLESIGSMPVPLIDDVTGLATGSSLVGFIASQCPFGGSVELTGHVLNPSTGLFGGAGYQYRILVSTNGGTSSTPMTEPFTVETFTFPSLTPASVTQTPDPVTGWVDYRELSGAVDVVGNVLGGWSTAGNADLWISMEARQGSTSLGATPWKMIQLDNTAPSPVTINITSGAGSCGDFEPGDLIEGTFFAEDNENLRGVTVSVEGPMPGAVLTQSIATETLTTESGTWSLQTLVTTEPCGYVMVATAADNTIVDSGFIGWTAQGFQGLCIRPLES
jgi:hypothetical protein